jgi:iduronate 2-sulfatase
VASSWTERFNSPGLEAHTPGDYACLNLNIFTTDLQGRESTKMPNRPFVTVQYEGEGSDQADYKSATKAIELLRQQKQKNEPFLLAVGFVRPHYPMVAPKQYFAPYPWQEIQLPETHPNDYDDIPKPGLSKTLSSKNPIGKYPDNQKRMWAGYYAAVSFMDGQVGRIIDELERLGLRESTAIVFISDHGYHLGEHGFWQKSNLHEDVTRVPMIISAPGFRHGTTTAPVELVDLYPTLSDLLGFEVPKEVQGQSLVPILRDPTARVREGALSIHNGFALRGDRWAYMRYDDGSEELYDMISDWQQFTNLASSPEHQEALAQNRAALETRLAREGIAAKQTINKNQNR